MNMYISSQPKNEVKEKGTGAFQNNFEYVVCSSLLHLQMDERANIP